MFGARIDSNGAQQISFTNDGGHFFTTSKDFLRVF